MRTKHLETLLEGYVPVSPAETRFAAAMRSLVIRGEDAFSPDHFDPGHFTASAFVLSPDRSELLLILHSKLHKWLQPGGHIDPEDETVVDAARREVTEETGVSELELSHTGLFDIDVHDIPPLKSNPPHQHFDLRFLFRSRTRALAPATDAEAARWVPLGEVGAIESDQSVMRAVQRIVDLDARR